MYRSLGVHGHGVRDWFNPPCRAGTGVPARYLSLSSIYQDDEAEATAAQVRDITAWLTEARALTGEGSAHPGDRPMPA
jgi:hypothetical protein